MDIDYLLGKVKDAVFDDKDTPYQRGDSHGLIEKIEQLFGRRGEGTMENPTPASEDPLGDPADQLPNDYAQTGYPSSQGDQYPNVRSASEDPLGDPADRERYA
jgi:hypothetical protein